MSKNYLILILFSVIGSYVNVELSDETQVIGRAFLSCPKNANFIKISPLCSNLESRKPKNNLKLKELHYVDKVSKAIEVEITVICQDVQTTLSFEPKFLLKCLKNVVFKSGFVIDIQPIFNEMGVEYVIIKEVSSKFNNLEQIQE